jgi:hypothetical protein
MAPPPEIARFRCSNGSRADIRRDTRARELNKRAKTAKFPGRDSVGEQRTFSLRRDDVIRLRRPAPFVQ